MSRKKGKFFGRFLLSARAVQWEKRHAIRLASTRAAATHSPNCRKIKKSHTLISVEKKIEEHVVQSVNKEKKKKKKP